MKGGTTVIQLHTGCGATVATALDEALAKVNNPQMLLFFVDSPEVPYVTERLYELFPGITTMGTMGRCFTNDGYGQHQVYLLEFDYEMRIRCGVMGHISECPVLYIHDFISDLQAVEGTSEDTVCLEMCAGGNEDMLVSTLNAVLSEQDIRLVGGTICPLFYEAGTPFYAGFNGGVYTDACVYAIIRNMRGRVRVYRENIFVPKQGAPLHTVTGMGRDKRAIAALDGRPAAEMYREEAAPVLQRTLPACRAPIARIIGDHFFVVDLRDVTEEEILTFKRANLNDAVMVCEPGDYAAINQETVRQIREEVPQVAFVLTINCYARTMFLEQERFIDAYVTNMAGIGEHFGVVTAGEQYRNQFVNATMVALVFEGTSPEGGVQA